MNIKDSSTYILILALTAAISSGVTYWLCSSHYEAELLTLREKQKTLEDKERNAIVTKRISEQMEDIAYQAKNIADSARQKAEFEGMKALEQARRADEERRNALIAKSFADKAEQEAREQAAKAERERLLAQEARDAADLARGKADTLRYIALGKSLSQTSITEYNTGNHDLARLLSFAAYSYTTQYGASPYQQDVFTSVLYNTHSARRRLHQFTGAVSAVLCIGKSKQENLDEDILVATDYGEVARLTPRYHANGRFNDFDVEMLFSDKRYFFQNMLTFDNMAYLLDVEGRLVAIDLNKGNAQKPQVLNLASSARQNERWKHLLKKKDGTMIAVGEHQLYWVDPHKKNEKGQEQMGIYLQHYIPEDITEAGIGDGKLLVFTKQHKYFVFMAGIPAEWPLVLPNQGTITSYYFHKGKKYHVLGTDLGSIYFYDTNGEQVSSFNGHTGAITHMEHYEWCFITSSYDKTLAIWNLDDIGGLVAPISIKCNAWPLTFAFDHKVRSLRIGYADGYLGSARISMQDNAATILRDLNRDFTENEWDYYIGKDVPYRRFKK